MPGKCFFQRDKIVLSLLTEIYNPLYSGNPKRVLLQTVNTQIKCSMMLHFIRVFTVCKGKTDL